MALIVAYYKVIEEIGIRSGLIEQRYRTVDMHWILDNKDLGRVRLTPEEYISGLEGIEKITQQQAEQLIAENGYKMGYEGLDDGDDDDEQEPQEQEQEVVDEQEENNENNENTDETQENGGESDGNGDETEQQHTPNDETGETETIENGDVGNVEDVLGGGDDENENNVEQENTEE